MTADIILFNVAEKFSATLKQWVNRILRLTKSNCAGRSLTLAALVVVKMSATSLRNQRRNAPLILRMLIQSISRLHFAILKPERKLFVLVCVRMPPTTGPH